MVSVHAGLQLTALPRDGSNVNDKLLTLLFVLLILKL